MENLYEELAGPERPRFVYGGPSKEHDGEAHIVYGKDAIYYVTTMYLTEEAWLDHIQQEVTETGSAVFERIRGYPLIKGPDKKEIIACAWPMVGA